MNSHFKTVKLLLFAALCLFSLDTFAQGGDEFEGPFNSWLNAKTGFGAAGNGITDDTKALQAALDAAAKGTVNSTLYIPAGTYLITHTLTVNDHINVSVIGAGPGNTIIKWGGAAHGTMMDINGTAYSKFDRITWNGNRVADVAVEQSWDGHGGSFDTGNEYADDVFVDVGFGIRGGSLGHGFAETSILRDQFIRNTSAGVSLGNFNALDIWIRNSLFQDCTVGVTNSYGAGNFKIYHSIFRNSAVSDISMNNTGEFSIRGNTSINSKQFFYASRSNNPAAITLEGNIIIDPFNTQAITMGNQGPTIFMNNTVRSRAAATAGPVAVFNSDLFSSGNTFTVAGPVIAYANKLENNNKIVPPAMLSHLAAPVFAGAEPAVKRRIFEVPAGAGAPVIQAIIDRAAKASGSRPVVHIPYGSYSIGGTLFIPAHSDMQLVGDGYGKQYGTILVWTGTTPGPVIAIAGPGKATLRDLTIKGNATITNILITNADQKGARVFLQEFNQSGGQTGMLVNGLDRTVVFGYDSQFADLKKAIIVIGGPLAAANRPAEGRTIIYSGAESNNLICHQVLNGGNLTVQDAWYEGGGKATYADLTGDGIFIAAGDHIATPQHTDVPSVMINNFSGTAAFIADDFTDRFAISGNSSRAKILALGIMAEDDPVVADNSSPKSGIKVLLSRARDHNSTFTRSGSYAMHDVGLYAPAFVHAMLAGARVSNNWITALPNDVSDVRFYRVMSVNGAVGLDIEAGKSLPVKSR